MLCVTVAQTRERGEGTSEGNPIAQKATTEAGKAAAAGAITPLWVDQSKRQRCRNNKKELGAYSGRCCAHALAMQSKMHVGIISTEDKTCLQFCAAYHSHKSRKCTAISISRANVQSHGKLWRKVRERGDSSASNLSPVEQFNTIVGKYPDPDLEVTQNILCAFL